MKRNEVGRLGLFDKKLRMPEPDVGTDHILHHIEHRGMTHQLIEPAKKQMRLVAKLSADGAAVVGLPIGKLTLVLLGLLRGKHRYWGKPAVIVELGNGLFGESLWQGLDPLYSEKEAYCPTKP